MNYQETLQHLERLLGTGMKLGLENIQRLLERMGSPQNRIPSIHVGGSNGKGSVCAFLSSILVQAGYRVGLTTSPHLVRVEERIALDNEPILPEAFAAAATHVRDTIETLRNDGVLERTPTYYEFLIATAFHVFHEEACDLQIIEVGMGGRLDATNTLAKPLVSVVTRIDIEHSLHLGSTAPEIAVEKAGIARSGVPLVTFEEVESTLTALEAVALEKGTTVIRARQDCHVEAGDEGTITIRAGRTTYKDLSIPLPGDHQIDNLALALRVIEVLRSKGYEIRPDHVALGVEMTRWPGRLEVMRTHPTVLLDGAHNPAGATALGAYLDQAGGDGDLLLVFGAMKDKDLGGVIQPLVARAARVFLTRSRVQRAEEPEELQKIADRFHDRVEVVADSGDAIDAALAVAGPEDTVLIAGSLILVGEAREYLARND